MAVPIFAEGRLGSTPEKGVPDMTSISDIDENGINHNLKVRYSRDQIYTYTGSILVAVNPYKEIDCYTTDDVFKYHGQKLGTLEPHVFALAEAAYRNMHDSDRNQSCVISGESGAGKTETTKFVLQYLCSVTCDVSTWVQQQILEANTILEAFGNAKTIRNDNSSRFGKFMQVCFDAKWCIKGCIIQDYLLEQSRITFQSAGERNYHVLYQLVAEGQRNDELAKTLYLRDPSFYRYLNGGSMTTNSNGDIEPTDIQAEAKRFEALRLAFTVLQIPETIINGILKVLSAILWLGNLNFEDIDGERCELAETDKKIIKIVAELLGLQENELIQVALKRQINVRGNITEIPLKVQEARENRNAMAKALYSRSFAWLISHINTCINPGNEATRFLGVLDIFGFENFSVNSFEQLCINFCNEKLQKFFNHYVFALEQEIYKQEEITFSHIQFTDNTQCLELIEKPPRCILKLLTEQCHMPKGSDTAYLTNLHDEFETNSCYIKGADRRHWETEFGIRHYAGCVSYAVEGFVDKNRDVQQDVLFDFMSRSNNAFVQELASYSDLLTIQHQNQVNNGTNSTTIQRGTSKGKLTVSDTFRQQLQSLVDVLQSTNPWYVRCIKPNADKLPNDYNDSLVLDQLRYLGMLDIIRIRREGFPIHMTFDEFITKYQCLTKRYGIKSNRDQVESVIRELNLPASEWQVGKTKVFLRSVVHEPLEDARKQMICGKAIIIQKQWRRYNQQKKYKKILKAVLQIQHAHKGWRSRIDFLRKRRACIVIQSHLRGVFAREVAAALREMRRVEEEMRKRERLEAERREREKEISDQQAEDERKALEECERICREELEALSEITHQINSKLNHSNGDVNSNASHQHSNESVDLDNLFAFLSEVTPNSTANNSNSNSTSNNSNHSSSTVSINNNTSIIDEIGETFHDLDVELENVLQQEMDVLGNENDRTNSNKCPPNAKMGVPSLPEPTTRPPPPPMNPLTIAPNAISNNSTMGLNVADLTTEVIPLTKPPQIPPNVKTAKPIARKEEPIYEAVIPRHELAPVVEIPEPIIMNSHEPSQKLRPKSPAVHQAIRSGSPQRNSIGIPNQTPPSPKNNRTSQRIASNPSIPNMVNGQPNPYGFPNERAERRKYRVEKKLQEMQTDVTERERDTVRDDAYFDILEFAENNFNTHDRTPEGTIIKTLTRKGRKPADVVPKCEMITYYRGNSIPTSHIHMYDPENVTVACNIFKDLCKYTRGELNPERELQVIQYIIGQGIEREELRDEIFVQCIRQATNNPHPEWTDRIWLLMCLTIVAFQPSKLLIKYYASFLKKNLETLDGKLRQYVQWCLDNCKYTKVSPRQYPPSSVEVAAMRRLGTIVCRFFFLDGRTKAIDVHPTDSASDAVQKLAEKLCLCNTDGWAIYQSRPDGEEHVKSHDYLYDIIAAWELKQTKPQTITTPTQMNGGTNTIRRNQIGSGENRFVFKKRLFKSTRELSQDPIEVNMLYAQAVYSVVKCDDFPVSEKVALQLSGLQAQVALGDPSAQPKPEYYMDVNSFLPERISRTRDTSFWVPILAQAHRQYGAGRSELTAKVLYLSCVMQYPLYGTTMFSVSYRGYWSYGNSLILGVNCDGLMLIKPDDKFVIYEFRYIDIESIMLDPSDSLITIMLNRTQNSSDQQRCFVFETHQKNEIGSLIVSYYAPLSSWIIDNEALNGPAQKRIKGVTNEDRVRFHHNVVVCRRHLIDTGELLRKPQDGNAGGFFRNTLRRISKHRIEKLRAEHGGAAIQDHGETYKGFPHAFWAFSKQQLPQSITKLPDNEEEIMLKIFQTILNYAGLGQNGETIQRAEDEHIAIIQTIMDRSMRKESLLNELYLQLIKQTTDHPDPNSRVNLRHWALLSLACSVILPPLKVLRKYLISHLKRCASDFVTEEGKYARFAEKCLYRTQGTRRRQWPPSREEIVCTINRRPIYARFHFMDGQYHSVEFHPSSTAREVMEIIKRKIGLNENAQGYAIYEVLGTSERSLMPDEKIADVMSKWEKYRNAAAQAVQQNQNGSNSNLSVAGRRQHHLFLFKKHLFYDKYMNLDDAVEKELLYHQVLHQMRSDRFPITEMEAVMLTALEAQLELGDYPANVAGPNEIVIDYRPVAAHCLPQRYIPNLPQQAVAMHHQSLRGMTPAEAKKSFLNLIQSWPLHKATIFDVMQTFTSNWPRVLWLAVDQKGVHLLEHRSRNTLCTYDYTSILSYSPNMNCLMIITGSDKKQSKVIITTAQAFQIANLIREYTEVLNAVAEEQVKEQFTHQGQPLTAAIQQMQIAKYQQMQQNKANPNNIQPNQSAHFRPQTLVAPQPS